MRKDRKIYSFNVGDKAKILLLGDREGQIGEVIGKERRPSGVFLYWVQFSGPQGCDIWDYYGDEMEPAALEMA